MYDVFVILSVFTYKHVYRHTYIQPHYMYHTISYNYYTVYIDDGWQSTSSKLDSENTLETKENRVQVKAVDVLHEVSENLTGTPISGSIAAEVRIMTLYMLYLSMFISFYSVYDP